jgi:hypothetical protein
MLIRTTPLFLRSFQYICTFLSIWWRWRWLSSLRLGQWLCLSRDTLARSRLSSPLQIVQVVCVSNYNGSTVKSQFIILCFCHVNRKVLPYNIFSAYSAAGTDLPGWESAFNLDCQAYTDNTTLCTEFGNDGGGIGFEDITAYEACIACGACDTCDGE